MDVFDEYQKSRFRRKLKESSSKTNHLIISGPRIGKHPSFNYVMLDNGKEILKYSLTLQKITSRNGVLAWRASEDKIWHQTPYMTIHEFPHLAKAYNDDYYRYPGLDMCNFHLLILNLEDLDEEYMNVENLAVE